jgi:segregation and condensation protein B
MSLRAKIEAVIYAAEEPVTLAQLSAIFAEEALAERAEPAAESEAADESALFGEPAAEPTPTAEPGDEEKRLGRRREREARETIRQVLDELIAGYDRDDRGMEIREIAGGYRVATRPEYHDAVRSFVKSLKPPMKLSLQALETLAVIAYKQPVTAPEVSEIRGVDSGGVLGSLISRKLVTTAGRKQVIGRPILYKTTKEFLLRFGLKDIAELPSMEEFEKMAGELVEPETETSARLDLPPAATETEQGDTPVPIIETEEVPSSVSPFEPEELSRSSASVAAQEEEEEEQLRVNARANVQVDDETATYQDLPGVTRDTAGRLNIDARPRLPSIYSEDEY